MNYGSNEDAVLYARQVAWAKALQDLRDEAKRLTEMVQQNDLTNSVEWIGRSAATEADRTNHVTLMLQLEAFLDGSAPVQADRRGVLSAFTVEA